MPEFRYARGRILESLSYITKEIEEYESEYALSTWKDYQENAKLHKFPLGGCSTL